MVTIAVGSVHTQFDTIWCHVNFQLNPHGVHAFMNIRFLEESISFFFEEKTILDSGVDGV